MKALLDTHAFLWALSGDERMSRLARDTFAGPAGLSLSIASVWEILIKVQSGKLNLPRPAGPYVLRKLAENGIEMLIDQHRPFARSRASPDASPRSVRSHVDCAEPGGEPSHRYLGSIVCPLRCSSDLVGRICGAVARPAHRLFASGERTVQSRAGLVDLGCFLRGEVVACASDGIATAPVLLNFTVGFSLALARAAFTTSRASRGLNLCPSRS